MRHSVCIFVGIAALQLSGCGTHTGIIVDKEVQVAYNDARNSYPPEYTNFFPNLMSGKLLSYHIAYPAEGYGLAPKNIRILMEYPKHKMDSILNYAYRNGISDYRFTDSCLLVVDYDPQNIRHFKNFKCIPDTLHQVPISNLEFLQNIKGIGDYENKATIYVFGWGRGASMDEKYLRKDRAGLPPRWEHGFSKGEVIWDNYVVYWLDVW